MDEQKKKSNKFCPRCCTFSKFLSKFKQGFKGNVCKKCIAKKRSKKVISDFKNKSRLVTKYAIKVGFLKKQPCRACGNIKVDAHHVNYKNPMSIWWLCKKHHTETHWKIK